MAFANQLVDLFDTSTWCGTDYEPLVDLIHRMVVPHAVHQQLAKNYVQAAALVSSTNVEEGRRSNRVNAISYVVQGFNKKSAEEVSQ